MNENKKPQSEFEKGRFGAMMFAGAVYIGVVIAVSTLFISFVLGAFDEKAYFQKSVMTIAGLLIGGSMLAFPYALHMWAISGRHRTVTTVLYFGEIFVIAVNTLVSFSSMLATAQGTALPEWVSLYEPFTILGAVYTLVAWAIVFTTDPAAKITENARAAEQTFNTRVSNKKLEFLDSIQGEDAIMAVALADIAESFNPDRFSKEKKNFGTAKTKPAEPALAEQLFTKKQSSAGSLPELEGGNNSPLA